MALYSLHSSLLLCFLLALFLVSNVSMAARQAPVGRAGGSDEKKQEECLEEGSAVIPGIGRYELGSNVMPGFGGLDHSGPAAANGQYLPGNDDTFVPNPGFEVPNPAHGAVP